MIEKRLCCDSSDGGYHRSGCNGKRFVDLSTREPIERHPASARFHEILAGLAELHDRKQADYGRSGDPFANVRASERWGVPPWVGAMIRANDKVARLQSLIENGRLVNESVEDSLRDLAVYAVIALVLYEERQAEKSALKTDEVAP